MSRSRSYDFHGTDDVRETEHQRLARITGLDEATVEAAFAEPVVGLIQTDAELERVHERIERGEQAEAELMYRALRRDFPGYVDEPEPPAQEYGDEAEERLYAQLARDLPGAA